jgi:Secretion system C-terminal sorting domain
MKKFYLAICKTVVLLCFTSLVHAQFLGGVFTTIPAGGDLAIPATWVGGAAGQPPDNCSNCQILVFGNSSINNPGIDLDNHSQIIIEAGAVLTINARVQIMDSTEVLIGSNGINMASIVMNAEGDLYSLAYVRLANDSSFIDATSGATSPSDSVDGIYGGGLYYITGSTTYNVLISSSGYGNPVINPPLTPTYLINCFTTVPPPPNACTQGVVYGPALSDTNTVDNSWEFDVAAVLPVQLLKFAAVLRSDQTVDLSWATAQEVNSSYFSIHRSDDGSSFQDIGKVDAKGFSSITTDYSFHDPTVLNGTAYYRLKIVDLDGKFVYSKVLKLSTDVKGNSVLVFSNPFTDQVRLQINVSKSDQMNLSLTDILGRSILKQAFTAQVGSNFVNLEPAGILPGVYMLNIKSNMINQTIKLIKQ